MTTPSTIEVIVRRTTCSGPFGLNRWEATVREPIRVHRWASTRNRAISKTVKAYRRRVAICATREIVEVQA